MAAERKVGKGVGGSDDLLPGTLDAMILACVANAPNHGYGIARDIARRAGGDLLVEEGSLYPALHRLQARGDLTFEWKTTEFNRRGKFYSLTASGKKRLRVEMDAWQRMSAAVSHVLGLMPMGGTNHSPKAV